MNPLKKKKTKERDTVNAEAIVFSAKELESLLQRFRKADLFSNNVDTFEKIVARIKSGDFAFAKEIKEILDSLETTTQIITDALEEAVDANTRLAVYGFERTQKFEEIQAKEKANADDPDL